jgi:hypothetical protein
MASDARCTPIALDQTLALMQQLNSESDELAAGMIVMITGAWEGHGLTRLKLARTLKR